MKLALAILATNLVALVYSYATGNSVAVLILLLLAVLAAVSVSYEYEKSVSRQEAMRRHPAGKGRI